MVDFKEEKGEYSKEKVSRSKKASIISDVIFYMVLVLMVILAFIFSRGNSNPVGIGGYRIFGVLTSSMESVIPRGSMVLVKETPAMELVVGDDITFLRADNNVITHRIIEIKENYEGSGQRGFVMQGVDNATADTDIVLAGNVIGKVTKSFPQIGTILGALRENIPIVVVFFVALIACSFCLKIFWREKDKEKNEEENEEKETLNVNLKP